MMQSLFLLIVFCIQVLAGREFVLLMKSTSRAAKKHHLIRLIGAAITVWIVLGIEVSWFLR